VQEGTESENPEEVILFSGGLDSLGGAVQQSVLDGQKVVLVHHQSTDAMETRRQDLMNSLVEKSQQPPIYIPVSIRKDKSLSHEYTQRSRSFLYAALGTTVAQMWNLSRIRFYENGVVSLNLPICGEVVGARATRTTHPRVLDGFARLFSEIAGREFSVENPFLWKTKTEVLELIGSAGCSELIQYTTSCTRTREMTIAKPHCGACSQCIDRRFAVLAAGLESADPESEYRVELLCGERNKEDSLAMLVSYIQMAREISTMDTGGFFAYYGEVSRVLPYIGDSPDAAAAKIFELHQRHARKVLEVIKKGIAKNAPQLASGELPETCLLRLASGSSWATGQEQPESELGNYVFRRRGEMWEIRFAGGEIFNLRQSKGLDYLCIFLSNPGKEITAMELYSRASAKLAQHSLSESGPGSEVEGVLLEQGLTVSGEDGEEVLDDKALKEYKKRISDLEYLKKIAEESGDLDTAERHQQEIDAIEQQRRQATGLGGRKRRIGDNPPRLSHVILYRQGLSCASPRFSRTAQKTGK
jgi:7-cyano-7-deazaguanine synthase in queuosine biosynthesis